MEPDVEHRRDGKACIGNEAATEPRVVLRTCGCCSVWVVTVAEETCDAAQFIVAIARVEGCFDKNVWRDLVGVVRSWIVQAAHSANIAEKEVARRIGSTE